MISHIFLNFYFAHIDPFCICLQEIHINKKSFIPPEGYLAYKSLSSERLGTGLLVHNRIPYAPISLKSTIQVVAARIYIEKSYTVCSIYIPPNEKVTYEELEKLLSLLKL